MNTSEPAAPIHVAARPILRNPLDNIAMSVGQRTCYRKVNKVLVNVMK